MRRRAHRRRRRGGVVPGPQQDGRAVAESCGDPIDKTEFADPRQTHISRSLAAIAQIPHLLNRCRHHTDAPYAVVFRRTEGRVQTH